MFCVVVWRVHGACARCVCTVRVHGACARCVCEVRVCLVRGVFGVCTPCARCVCVCGVCGVCTVCVCVGVCTVCVWRVHGVCVWRVCGCMIPISITNSRISHLRHEILISQDVHQWWHACFASAFLVHASKKCYVPFGQKNFALQHCLCWCPCCTPFWPLLALLCAADFAHTQMRIRQVL